MKCPVCGGKSRVLDTRGIIRRRECLDEPQHRFETTERISHVGARPQGRPLGTKNQMRRWDSLR